MLTRHASPPLVTRAGQARLLGAPSACDWGRRWVSRPSQAGIGRAGCHGYGRRRRSKMADEAAGGGGPRRGTAAWDRDRDEEGAAERGPGAAYHMFMLMEDLLDKLKLLSYEEEALQRHNMRPLSRCRSAGRLAAARPRGAEGPGEGGGGGFARKAFAWLWAVGRLGPEGRAACYEAPRVRVRGCHGCSERRQTCTAGVRLWVQTQGVSRKKSQRAVSPLLSGIGEGRPALR